MFKFAAIVSLMLVGSMWAASLSCDSCGSECTSACGTRHFRSCCFNYLRKKRTDVLEFSPHNVKDMKSLQELTKTDRLKPVFIVQNIPEEWASNAIPFDYRPYDDVFENRYFDV